MIKNERNVSYLYFVEIFHVRIKCLGFLPPILTQEACETFVFVKVRARGDVFRSFGTKRKWNESSSPHCNLHSPRFVQLDWKFRSRSPAAPRAVFQFRSPSLERKHRFVRFGVSLLFLPLLLNRSRLDKHVLIQVGSARSLL